jgi:hypothetical protein
VAPAEPAAAVTTCFLPSRSMVGLTTLTRPIGVRIPGGQPIPVKTELLRTSLNILAREDVLVLQWLA